MEGVEAPVEAIKAKVFGKPIFELIFALEAVSGGRARVGGTLDEQYPGFGCILRVAR